MESFATAPLADKQALISAFLEVAFGQSEETAAQFLQATDWQLEEAIHLFYIGNESGGAATTASSSDAQSLSTGVAAEKNQVVEDDGIRPPLPVVREALYNDAHFFRLNKSSDDGLHDFVEVPKRPDVWDADQNTTSTSHTSGDNLASLYRPPLMIMYSGSFAKAKVEASLQGKWLLVNLQSRQEFASHMLNRDTWSNEAVVDVLQNKFIFWQELNDTSEGRKVCTYYNLVSLPAILLIDPITGQKIYAWTGMVHPDNLLEDLLYYLDKGPRDHIAYHPESSLVKSAQDPPNISPDVAFLEDKNREAELAMLASLEASKGSKLSVGGQESQTEKDVVTTIVEKSTYPPLPDEPKVERNLMCRVGIRLPDGSRLQRNFLREDSVKLLWSFCSSKTEKAKTRPFHFSLAIPGAFKIIKYEDGLTFEEAGLSNSIILLVWE